MSGFAFPGCYIDILYILQEVKKKEEEEIRSGSTFKDEKRLHTLFEQKTQAHVRHLIISFVDIKKHVQCLRECLQL